MKEDVQLEEFTEEGWRVCMKECFLYKVVTINWKDNSVHCIGKPAEPRLVG